MAKTFLLEIFTPERLFFAGEIEALTVETTDGEMTILADHTPITAPLQIGKIKIKQTGEWKEAFQSEGFLEIDGKEVHLFVQACEWPEDIDVARANAAEHRAKERLRQQKSMMEYRWTQSALARAMARLRVTQDKFHL
ncbi:MAG: ATP synthase F1 subunit epsilon [Christensenellaceae bacterium]|jgi:F-type H+-transporting ATPase subunit epsilon